MLTGFITMLLYGIPLFGRSRSTDTSKFVVRRP